MKISEAFELYREDFIVPKNQSPKTEESHSTCMRNLIKFFGDIEVESLTRSQVREWRQSLTRRSSVVTEKLYVVKLRVVLGYLLGEGYPVIDPIKIPLPKLPDPIVNFLTPEQVKLFINSVDSYCHLTNVRNKTIISLLYSSGIRIAELCRLNKDDVTGKNFFTVMGKGGVAAPSFIDHRTQVYIMTYLRMRKDDNPALFLSENGNRIRPLNIQEVFCHISQVTGIKATPHTLRHSFATNLLRNGGDIRHVQRFLKHKNIQSTAIYTHVLDSELEGLHKRFHSI